MMLSIVMPFYRRADVFRETFAANRRFISEDTEVVVAMDDPEGAAEVVAFAGQQAGKWLVVLNECAHAWRNPAKAINVGIRMAAGSHILVVSPETEFLTDVPGVLFKAAKEKPDHYHFGEITLGKAVQKYSCGSICAAREAFENVRGYDESLVGWGADDDNLRARMRLSGVFGVLHKEAQLRHPGDSGKHRRYSADTRGRLRELVRPQHAVMNGEAWGTDFNKIIHQT